VVPLLLAALIAAFSMKLPRRVVEIAAIACSVAAAVMCLVMLADSSGQPILHWFAGWRPSHGFPLGIDFAVDSIGAGTAALVSLLVTAALVYSVEYFEETVEQRYTILMLVFLGGMNGIALTGDLFDLFVFFELMSVAAYALTGLRVEEAGPLQGAINFAFLNSLGSFCVLLGIGVLYGRTGTLNLARMGVDLAGRDPDALVVLGFTLLAAGFFVKAGIVPFHFWLADAYGVVALPVGVLFAGIMSELGLFCFARTYWTVFQGSFAAVESGLRAALLGIGTVTALVGAVMTFAQQHLKRMLAFTTVSRSGLFLIGIGLFDRVGLAGVVVYALGDGLVRGALFLAAGILVYRLASIDEEDLRGQGRGMWLAAGLFLAGGLALAEAPPFGTFTGKTLIEQAASEAGYHWVPWVFGIVAALTGGAMLRAAGRVFLGWGPDEPDRFGSERSGEHATEGLKKRGDRTPSIMLITPAVLLAAGLVLGLLPGLSSDVQRAVHQFEDRRSYAAAVLERGPTIAERPIEPEPLSVLGVWYGLASTGGAVAVALLALFRRRIVPAAVRRRAVRVLGPPILRFRTLHSGHVGDYVAWFVLGLAALGGLFALGLL
jgi:multicomponent Na+:H+ antiporter subunit D